MPESRPPTSQEPSPGVSFKRGFLFPGIVLTFAELLVVVWPVRPLFEPNPEQWRLMTSAAIPLFAAATLIWLAAMATWLAPVQKADSLRRRGEPLDPQTATAA